jgi:hypothetical protein
MEEKKNNVSVSNANHTLSFIKSLGGAKSIYSFLISKNININIESIYKWKNNGIPHRYLLYIKELADSKSIAMPQDVLPNSLTSARNKTEITSISNNIIKKNIIAILFGLLFITILIIQFLYYQSNNKSINQKLLKLENLTTLYQNNDYDKKLASINNFIKNQTIIRKKHSSDISNISITTEDNKNKLKDLEKSIKVSLNSKTEIQNPKLYNFNKTLISLIILKDNIRFSEPNLSYIDLINNYFSQMVLPDDITLSLLNLNSLSKVQLKSHNKLMEEITFILIDINNKISVNKKDNNKFDILTYLKSFITISKINNSELKNKSIIESNIINSLNSYNYEYILNKFKSVKNNIELNIWLKNINDLNILITSLDNIINWLIYKG